MATDTDQVSAVREVAPRHGISPPMLEGAGASAPGPDRPVDQDAFGLWPELGLCVVADGMGGRPAGEVAARLAVVEVHAFLAESDPERTPPIAWDVSRGLAAGMLARAVEQANMAVYAAGLENAGWKGMGAATDDVTAVLVRLLRGVNRRGTDHASRGVVSASRAQAA